jgi:hypothetical protein
MKNFLLISSCLIGICLFALISQAKYGKAESGAVNDSNSVVASVKQAGVVINIGAYAAAGLPVTLVTGRLGNERGFNELPCRINLARISEVESANLVLFELDPVTGKLRGSESWTQRLDPATAKPDERGVRGHEFALRVRRTLAEKSAVVLALESVSGTAGTWEIDFTELFQTVVTRNGGRSDEALVRQNPDRASGDYGSNYCARAFALAFHLSKFSERAGTPAFSCDQQQRAYAVAYLARASQ